MDDRLGTESVTGELARFIASASLPDFSSATMLGAKRSLVDALGVAVAGSREAGPTILARYVRELEAKPCASVIGCGFKSAIDLAAWVGATAADVLGWADFSVVQMNHPSAAVGPCVMALAEAEG